MRKLTDQIRIIHRYLLDQILYPILLSTAFALVLFSLRVIESYTLAYSNLIWNLFLAWVPFLFSLWAVSLYNARANHRWVIILPGLLWLLFFPNAPYIITDFLHLKERPGIPIWYDILMLAAFTWTGFFLAITSLRTMQLLVKKHAGWLLSWFFAGFVLALAGVGIYLGRFSRWNSWDIFFSPREIMLDVAVRVINPLSNLNFYGFTSIITALLVICYIMFISLRREPKIGA